MERMLHRAGLRRAQNRRCENIDRRRQKTREKAGMLGDRFTRHVGNTVSTHVCCVLPFLWSDEGASTSGTPANTQWRPLDNGKPA